MKKSLFYLPSLLIAFLAFTGCARQLESGLSEDDAQQIVVLLREHQINASVQADPTAKKDAITYIVTVQGRNDTVIRAWKLLEENGLPREKVKGLDSVFADAGMIPTAAQEKARLITGLNGEITRTLDSVSGVVDSRVQVVLPDNSPLLDKSEQAKPTASVLVQYRGSAPPLAEQEVKSLVAKSIEGLTPDNVAVVFKRVEVQELPIEVLGPLPLSSWIEVAAVAVAVLAGLVSLLLVSVSKVRKQKIKSLEKRVAELEASTTKQPVLAKG
jgi:type III secretion protein J